MLDSTTLPSTSSGKIHPRAVASSGTAGARGGGTPTRQRSRTGAMNRPKRRGGKVLPTSDQRFSAYLSFGFSATVCLCVFLSVYALMLLGVFFPLLQQDTPTAAPKKRGEVLKPVVDHAVDQVKHHIPDQVKSAFSNRVDNLREKLGISDAHLMEQAAKELHAKKQLRKGQDKAVREKIAREKIAKQNYAKDKIAKAHAKKKPIEHGHAGAITKKPETAVKVDSPAEDVVAEDVPAEAAAAEDAAAEDAAAVVEDAAAEVVATAAPLKTYGYVVLGMHRSGTSMLSGLLTTGMGYNTGGPLIGAGFDNEKGFFERIDVVLQNDEFMKPQGIWWNSGVIGYNPDKAYEAYKKDLIPFENGATALAFLNDRANAPWLQKDPRMCITLKTWLKLLDKVPAVVFTYRHPLEVALSLKKREKNFELERGLRLWIVYNMRAVQNSAGMCRVFSSNEAVLADPQAEVQRISDELTSKCGVPAPPKKIDKEDVEKFVDPNLQHNKRERQMEEEENAQYIEEYGEEKCKIKEYESDYQEGSANRARERRLYISAMHIFCDLKNGKAYERDYEWPKL